MSHLSPFDRPLSRVSLAPSDRTYHSFHDVEPSEPRTGPRSGSKSTMHEPQVSSILKEDVPPVIQEMRRQDSGYESLVRRDSESSRRRTSTTSVTSSTRRRRAKSSKSGPVAHVPRRTNKTRSSPSAYPPRQQPQPVTYFHFPHFTTAEPVADETEMTVTRDHGSGSDYPSVSDSAYPPPPQTTHYWTSDRTRRLEYAAIDAASRGIRGWVRRHIVPDCFIPKEKRHIGFEDDRGSVVRYRLELEEGEDGAEKNTRSGRKRRRGWWFTVRNN
ncbi:hypothetical protein B0H66DRAFT_299109 [Apodospora peruviana]|uniref:Uncharacterized protein n=1 Tax=Apodospora peruviana TaxID=516989 RepID=A0AAE0I0Y9_9PEZI|nr:hypothetical protein B0H66DRAFT_299109 [Apodospora peruviana]